jgi:hypothetical protein
MPWPINPSYRVVLGFLVALVTVVILFNGSQATDAGRKENLLVNGNFEGGFLYHPSCGHVGIGWNCFTNSGQTNYGFYDDQWPPVVAKGEHSQLIEINTKNLGVADPDRYAGIYQTVRVEPGVAYQFDLRGMIRTTDNASANRDPYRVRVQFGWSFGEQPDWRRVENWRDVGWNTYHERLEPGRFDRFGAKILAQEPFVTVYVRVWKKWGDIGEEIDVNLDSITLVTSSVDALVLPTLTPTPLAPDDPQPLLLNGGTPVASLPTPPGVYGQVYVSPTDVRAVPGWPRLYGVYFAFSYPNSWTPEPSPLSGNRILEEYRLGIPDVVGEQIIGFSSAPFGDIRPPDMVQMNQISIGGQEGVKWLRQGAGYVVHEYCTRGAGDQGSFCVRVTLTASSPMLELQLDRLVSSIDFVSSQ